MRKTLRKFLSLLLALSMVASFTVTGWAVGTTDSTGKSGVELELEELDPGTLNVPRLGEVGDEEPAEEPPAYGLNDIVRVSIFLDKPATLDMGYSTQNIAANRSAMAYRQTLRRQQASVTASIERVTGSKLDVKWNLTLAANAISANVRYGDIAAIEKLSGVRSVVLENQYEPYRNTTARPDTAVTTEYMVGATESWAAGYTGAGSRVAIIDTGLDTEHQSFNADAFDYALAEDAEKAGKTVADYNLLDADGITAVAGELNASVTASRAYLTTKIPYAYNYVDGNYTVNHMSDRQGEHGSHVAGIATGNRYIKDGSEYVDAATSVFAVGVAPDAQVMVMKVFGAGGGAYDSDYFAAIEDAIVLKADSVNLSLGSSVAGFSLAGEYQTIMDGLVTSGTVVGMSAGNNSSWGTNSDYGALFGEDVGFQTGGSPGSFTNSLTIASADNVGAVGMPVIFNGSQSVFYTETESTGAAMKSIGGTYDYVYIDGIGDTAEYAAVNPEISLEGKIVIVNRGSLSFVEKGNNLISYKPAALMIANNQAGTINMALDDYTGTFPMVSFLLSDAIALKDASASQTIGDYTVYTGTAEVTDTLQGGASSDRSEAQLSSFSSFGVPGSLVLKPELTTPGGNIWSVNGAHLNENTGAQEATDHATYESMSGTSMAAPHANGMAAVVAQYIRENGLAKWTDGNARTLINSLLMSTATPMTDADGYYLSVLGQGAGLGSAFLAIQAKSFITMNEDATASYADGKVKVELGDDPDRTGAYSYSFNITNMSDQDLTYELGTDMFTQYLYQGVYLLEDTDDLDATVSYVWGEAEGEQHDVNKDGTTDTADAQAILDYLTGKVDAADLDLAAGDMDEDEAYTSYDAHLLLAWLEDQVPADGYVVPAGETVTVTVNIQLNDVEAVSELYPNGFYVEGYTYVTCTSVTDEGEKLDVEHSIPIMGFCGSWTDPNMFDRSTAVDAAYSYFPTYFADNEGKAGLNLKYSSGRKVVFAGNPYIVEDEFPADRLAISNGTTMQGFSYGLLRNAATVGYVIQVDGKAAATGGLAQNQYAPYYYPAQSAWQGTGLKSTAINKEVSTLGLEEGDQFTVGLYAVPEYYGMQLSGGTTGNLTADQLSKLVTEGGLGEGAGMAYTFTIDDTTPEILSAERDGDNITISAKDDRYIAYIGVMDVAGTVSYVGVTPEQTEPGQTVEETFALDAETMGNGVAVFVGDYAGNETAMFVRLADGPITTKTTVWMLTDTLEAGKEYIISDANAAGEGHVLNSQGTDYYTNSQTVTIVSDAKGTYIPEDAVQNSFVWTSASGITFTNKNDGGALGYNSLNYPFVSWSDPGYADSFTYSNNQLRVTRAQYMNYSGGYFMYSGTAGNIYLYTPTTIEEELDPDNVSSVTLTPSAITLILGVEESLKLAADVQPMVVADKSLTWTTSDAGVVTVDANGVITAVAKGTATVTATSNQNPAVSGTCVVNVTDANPMDAVVYGQVAFSADDIQFAAIDLNDMSTTKDGEAFSAFYGGGRSGNYVYGNDEDNDFHRFDITNDYAYDSDAHFSIVADYAMLDAASIPAFTLTESTTDEETGETTVTAEVESIFDVLCVSPAGYLELLDVEETSLSYFDVAGTFGAAPVAMAFTGLSNDQATGQLQYLYYYVMDAAGVLWIVRLAPEIADGEVDFGMASGKVGQINVITMNEDTAAYSMAYAYYQTGADSIFIADNNNQSIWYVDLSDAEATSFDATYVGRVDGATNLSSLYNDDFDSVAELSAEQVQSLNSKLSGTTVKAVSADAQRGQRPTPAGGLNAVTGTTRTAPVARPLDTVISDTDDNNNATVTISAAATNGLYSFTYDADAVTFVSADANVDFWSYNDAEGTVKVAFAAAKEVDAEIELTFTAKSCEDSEITSQTLEQGEALTPEDPQTLTVTGLGHDWGEPTWEWAEDYATATATFVCSRCGETVTLDAEVTSETDELGNTTYTATVTGPDDKQYTDTQVVEATGFKIIVDDKTNGAAATDLVADKLYSGDVTFTVTADSACLVALVKGESEYEALTCTDVDGAKTFTVTVSDADVTVVIVFKGDADLDGTVVAKDATLVKQVAVGNKAFETDAALQALVADVTGDGAITAKDGTKLSQVVTGMSSLNW
jgi:lactocepin